MDNISHSVASIATGALLHRSLPAETDSHQQGIRQRLLLIACGLAGNFPDLDLLLTPLLPAPLGYLLHHRGHTHTVLYALPQALLLALLLYLLWSPARRLLHQSATARAGLMLSIGIGFALHLLMDSLNSYGLHPFYPIDARWLYGDMVFIIEPVFWVAFGMPLVILLRRKALRFLLAALLMGVPLYFTIQGYLGWSSFAALSFIGIAAAWEQLRAGERGRRGIALSFALALCFVAVQYQASQRGKSILAMQLAALDPATRVLDMALSAYPANPLCWSFASVESNETAGSYGLKRGVLSIAPELMPVSSCPAAMSEPGRQHAVATGVALFSQEQDSLKRLRRLREDNCYFDGWLRFARMPSVSINQATDIRFASNLGENFTTLRFDTFAHRACPIGIPAWDYPREDLLTPK